MSELRVDARSDVTVGLVVTVFNRPDYLREALASLTATRHPFSLFLINDAGTDPAANRLFDEFDRGVASDLKVVNPTNQGMFACLRAGWNHFFSAGYEVLCNLDSDAVVTSDWLDVLLGLHRRFPNRIISGFHTENHPAQVTEADHRLKNTVGGINLLFGRDLYPSVEPTLHRSRWDWRLCVAMQKAQRRFVVSRPSVVQHIGKWGLHSSPGGYDVAPDFAGRAGGTSGG